MDIETRAGTFQVQVLTEVVHPDAQVTVIIVNSLTSQMTLNALASFRKFNDIPTNYVVVDNFSDQVVLDALVLEAGEFATVISNHGEPKSIKLGHWDSLLNAIGLDIGSRFVQTPLGFVCHNDVLACRPGWLRRLTERLTEKCRGASFSQDNDRIKAMHVSGYLYDTVIYPHQTAFWYPIQGKWDVGDHYTHMLREAGMDYHVCKCTHNSPELEPRPEGDPRVGFGHAISTDCAMDDEGNVIYMHMGRGSAKSIGTYSKPGKTTHDEWVVFGSWLVESWTGSEEV